MPFNWHPNDPPPKLEEHTKAKLDVLRRYLRAYFDRLGTVHARDEFRLDLVDGFAGGGIFGFGDAIESGTPLIMLEEYEAARSRLNEGRTKPLHFDLKFHFVDVNRNHMDHLQNVLADRGYRADGEKIVVHNTPFECVADEIIADVLRRQPRAGRAIFLLDQTGFKQVELALVARILSRLPRAEVILTFASDVLINFLSPQLINAVAPLELTDSQVQEMIAFRNGDGGRALTQRVLREQIRRATGASYDTPFFIRPKLSRRALWFLHLSRHPIARDVMIQCHWDSSNIFEHYGSGDFDMLGWDALHTGQVPLFNFTEFDANRMRDQLLHSMPVKLYALAAEGPIPIEKVRARLANETAARFSDLDQTILDLTRRREFDILGANGKVRSRSLTRLGPTDRIVIPPQRLFPGF